MKYLVNALSLNMVPAACQLKVEPLTTEEAVEQAAEAVCAIGHPDTALAAGLLLGRELQAQRLTLALERGDVLFVAQYIGDRLPEGTTELPPGARLEWRKVTVS